MSEPSTKRPSAASALAMASALVAGGCNSNPDAQASQDAPSVQAPMMSETPPSTPQALVAVRARYLAAMQHGTIDGHIILGTKSFPLLRSLTDEEREQFLDMAMEHPGAAVTFELTDKRGILPPCVVDLTPEAPTRDAYTQILGLANPDSITQQAILCDVKQSIRDGEMNPSQPPSPDMPPQPTIRSDGPMTVARTDGRIADSDFVSRA